MEETISLRELFYTLKKRLWLIVVIAVLAATVSAIISFFVLTPIYQSSTQILVNQAKNNQQLYNYNEVQTNVQLINTYSVIIKKPIVLDDVKKELKLSYSTEELTNKIAVASEKDSQVFSVTVEDPDPVMAAKIANTTAQVFQNKIPKIMSVDNVSILSKAALGEDPSPIKPKPLLNIAIALVVGVMLGVGLAFLLEYLDNTIKTEQDVEQVLGLPVLGVITVMDGKSLQDAAAVAPGQRTRRGEVYDG
ncbi:YveK family protein [Priestia koreensis]|uniref:Capsular biosynthesis protein n=1 Tax=Priestia koreensis TaxID=284581 RepID=A0A0M0LHH1_9BACI|nr:YveK family protein [Priestia koreensis]KOO50436.1 capsular biosynthesis protein [Priestia koreensis]